jgi:hypothetical protein
VIGSRGRSSLAAGLVRLTRLRATLVSVAVPSARRRLKGGVERQSAFSAGVTPAGKWTRRIRRRIAGEGLGLGHRSHLPTGTGGGALAGLSGGWAGRRSRPRVAVQGMGTALHLSVRAVGSDWHRNPARGIRIGSDRIGASERDGVGTSDEGGARQRSTRAPPLAAWVVICCPTRLAHLGLGEI